MARPLKFVFVTGGVLSGVGKGITTASISLLLESRGYRVAPVKIDPYINVDAGTMNPTEHGEVFVLDSGLETDQDMGNYERFLGRSLPSENYMTTGSVYLSVIRRERNLEYKGRNVEVVPDIPAEVIRRIRAAGEKAKADVVLVEIGGTVGEYQNILFLEAIRMLASEDRRNVATVLVSYLPVPGSIGEMKTKPTQYAARTLNSAGVFADVIIARAPVHIDAKRREKIARFCNVREDHVISAPDVASIYDVPLNFERDGLGDALVSLLGLPKRTADLSLWKKFTTRVHNPKKEITIAIVGKYFASGDFVLSDAYVSVIEALRATAAHAGVKARLDWIDAEDIETGVLPVADLRKYDGILVPGGFGTRGIEGIIMAIKEAREQKIPYFGLCYGMQLLVIEYARHKAKLAKAHTTEVDPKTPHPVVVILPEQKEKLARGDYGGSMRLGAYPAVVVKGTQAALAYKANEISERHRHRYEVNPEYVERLRDAGLVFSATSPDGSLMEIAELPKKEHPFFLGSQFHPEFLSRPLSPHPLFAAFVKAAKERK